MERRVFGIETEYAMAEEGADRRVSAADPGGLFDLLDAALTARFSTLESDSFGRDPGRAHGGGIEIKEGRFLESGARVYYDAGHVEWATPECPSARQAALYELAGERTLAELAAGLSLDRGSRLLLIKNNIDYTQERTFGCHENYLVERGANPAADRAKLERLVRELVPFLVTRQIFTGAGKLSAADVFAPFQLSQRADFIECVMSHETRARRGIVNTRDESLGDRRFRRLHLILGDSNRSPLASVLKLGTTGLVLQLIEAGALADVPQLVDPVAALRAVSCDPTCRQPLPLQGGHRATALEVQGYYLEKAERAWAAQGRPEGETAELLLAWRRVLQDLAADPVSTADRVDWMIKLHHLLEPRLRKAGVRWGEVGAWSRVLGQLRERRPQGQAAPLSPDERARFQYLLDSHRLSWSDFERQQRLYFELRECDLRYHDIDTERGLFALLDRGGLVARPFGQPEIDAAQMTPPASRAALRSQVIRWAHGNGRERRTLLDWGRVAFADPSGAIELGDPLATDHRELAERLGADDADIPIRILQTEGAPRPLAEIVRTVRGWLQR